MRRFFAIFLPVFAVIVTTLFIVMSQNKPDRVSKKVKLLILGIGIFLFLAGLVLFILILNNS